MPDARAFWTTAPGRGEIRGERLPSPGAGDVVVRALFSGISRGTESLVFNGRVPASEFARMRAPFQTGDFPWPVKYGYASVGRVDRGPDALRGADVFVLHPHQTRFVVPSAAVYRLPGGLPPERGILAANMETAVNGLWDASPRVGDSVTIVGGGTVGCLVAWLAARIVGCRVELVDINPNRAAVAHLLGVEFAGPDTASPERDLVIHASGSPAGLELALRVAGAESDVVEMSWYGDQRVALPLGEAFHARRLTIRSSQVGTIPPVQRARWTARRRMELALELLRRGPELDALITSESDFDTLPFVMAQIAASPGETLCHRVRYPQDAPEGDDDV